MLALTEVLPTPELTARPGVLLLITTTPIFCDAQETCVLRSCWLPSLNVPVALSGRLVPSGMLAGDGPTAMLDNVTLVTVSDAPPDTVVPLWL
jgi:hypothetical protein